MSKIWPCRACSWLGSCVCVIAKLFLNSDAKHCFSLAKISKRTVTDTKSPE